MFPPVSTYLPSIAGDIFGHPLHCLMRGCFRIGSMSLQNSTVSNLKSGVLGGILNDCDNSVSVTCIWYKSLQKTSAYVVQLRSSAVWPITTLVPSSRTGRIHLRPFRVFLFLQTYARSTRDNEFSLAITYIIIRLSRVRAVLNARFLPWYSRILGVELALQYETSGLH